MNNMELRWYARIRAVHGTGIVQMINLSASDSGIPGIGAPRFGALALNLLILQDTTTQNHETHVR